MITSPSSALTYPREFGSCKLCGKDFSIDSWLKMHIISKYQTNSQAPNQCTIPLSLHLLREFGSCKLCGKDFSINSWLKMHIISKYQTNSQAQNQCTIPLSLHLPRCLLRENSVPASCVVKIGTLIRLFLYHISREKKNISLYL